MFVRKQKKKKQFQIMSTSILQNILEELKNYLSDLAVNKPIQALTFKSKKDRYLLKIDAPNTVVS